MCDYAINCASGRGSFYLCISCRSIYYSPLGKPVEICLRCLLDQRNRRVLLKEYGSTERELLDFNTVKTQSQVAEHMGISRQRVQQIEISAIAKVRASLIKNAETKINMQNTAIAGRMERDINVLTSKNTGKQFIAGTIVCEEQGYGDNADKIFKTYWDFMGFGEENVARADSLTDGTAVCATGRPSAETYEAKDGTVKAKLKLIGNIEGLSSVAPPGGEPF